MSVIVSNTDTFREQFSGLLESCLRSEYKTGHLGFKVDFRGPLNPDSEELGISGTRKDRTAVFQEESLRLPGGYIGTRGYCEKTL